MMLRKKPEPRLGKRHQQEAYEALEKALDNVRAYESLVHEFQGKVDSLKVILAKHAKSLSVWQAREKEAREALSKAKIQDRAEAHAELLRLRQELNAISSELD